MLDSSAAIVTGNVNLLSLSTCLLCQACVSILCFLAYHCSFGLPTDQVPNQDNLPGINIPVLSHVSSSVHVAEQTWLSSPPPLSFGGLVCIPVCSCVWLPPLLICCTEKCPCQISLRIVTLISAYPYCSHGGTFCICQLKLFAHLLDLLMSAVLIPMTDFMLIILLSLSHCSSSYTTSIILSLPITVMSSI